MLKKLFSNSFIYAVGPQIPKLASIFLLPLYTQKLTNIDYGIFALITVYTGLLSGLRDLGMTQPLVNVFFKNKIYWKKIWGNIWGLLTFFSIPYLLLFTIILYFSCYNQVGNNFWIIVLLQVISTLLFDLPAKFGSLYFQLSAKPLPIAILSAVNGILIIAVQYVLVVWYNMHYMAFVYAFFLAGVIPFFYFGYVTFFKLHIFPSFKLKVRLLKGYLKVGLPLIPHNYSSYLLNISDRLVMDVLHVPQNKIGNYSFAYNFGSYADMVGTSIGMAVSPFSQKGYAINKEEVVKNLFEMLQLFFIVGSCFICIWMKEIFQILVRNDELRATYDMAIIIVMGYVYRPLYWGVISFLGFKERTSSLWKISFIASIINVALNFLLIPIWGYKVATLNTFISLLYLAIAGFYLQSYKQVAKVNYNHLRWLGCILLASVVTYFCKDLFVLYKIFFSMALVLIAFFYVYNKRELFSEFKDLM